MEKSKPCTDCKEKFHFCQMDFDHRDQSAKRMPISRMGLMGLDSIKTELEKTDLVCVNCHRDRTQLQPKMVAGTGGSYMTQYQRNLSKEISEFVNSLKHEQRCADCKNQHPYWRLDYDHKEGSGKLRTISKMKLAKYSREAILEEIAKCELVCARCHRLRSWNRQRAAKMGSV